MEQNNIPPSAYNQMTLNEQNRRITTLESQQKLLIETITKINNLLTDAKKDDTINEYPDRLSVL